MTNLSESLVDAVTSGSGRCGALSGVEEEPYGLRTDLAVASRPSGVRVVVTVASTFLVGTSTIESWAARMEVYDDGTGIEFEIDDPVLIDVFPGVTVKDLAGAHRQALRLLDRRRGYDYEVADLFIADAEAVG